MGILLHLITKFAWQMGVMCGISFGFSEWIFIHFGDLYFILECIFREMGCFMRIYVSVISFFRNERFGAWGRYFTAKH